MTLPHVHTIPAAGRALAQTGSVAATFQCPHCGSSMAVPARDGSRERVDETCRVCTGMGRWPPVRDWLSLILALEVHANAAIQNERDVWRGASRAARFNVRLPLQYRVSGSQASGTGTSVNISRSGLMCHTTPTRALRDALCLKPTVDVVFDVPLRAVDDSSRHVLLRGRVVWAQVDAHQCDWAMTVSDDVDAARRPGQVSDLISGTVAIDVARRALDARAALRQSFEKLGEVREASLRET